jgi:hypothetical protein
MDERQGKTVLDDDGRQGSVGSRPAGPTIGIAQASAMASVPIFMTKDRATAPLAPIPGQAYFLALP